LIWTRSGKTAIVSGEWAIVKAFIDGTTLYYLTRGTGPAIKYAEDAEALKELAETMEAGK